jgi:hypothetical protein
MPPTPVAGPSGRVQSGGVPVAGLGKWSITKNTQEIPYPHFEMPVDVTDEINFYPNYLTGLGKANVTFEGWVDTNETTATDSGTPGLSNGKQVTMDFILVKGTPWGFSQVPVLITQIEIGTAIDATTPASFKGTGVVQGGSQWADSETGVVV